MENIRKSIGLIDIGNDARRQFIDAQSVFTAWEDARKIATEVRGGMYWKRQGKADYLVRTRIGNPTALVEVSAIRAFLST